VTGHFKTSLLSFFDYCFTNRLPFAFYRLPNEKKIKVIAQKRVELKYLTLHQAEVSRGFIFAPFHTGKRKSQILIEPDIVTDEKNLPLLNFKEDRPMLIPVRETTLTETSKTEFVALVNGIKGRIVSGDFKKIVAARVIKKVKPVQFNSVKFYQKLCSRYAHAFVSLVYTHEHGLWIGASPEILVSVDDNVVSTYSLAGTKLKSRAPVVWGNKEQSEQKIVSDYILEKLSPFASKPPSIHGPETVTAGNLIHLRTTFKYTPSKRMTWTNVVTALHPTPAVAGLPKKKAVSFILRNEKSSRNFYSGYLGPVNINQTTHLFVNLRCMQVLEKSLALHVGCGITAESNALEEWNETKAKSQTLLDLL